MTTSIMFDCFKIQRIFTVNALFSFYRFLVKHLIHDKSAKLER